MNINNKFVQVILEIISKIAQQPILEDKISVDSPRETSHGDFATNAAMVVAKKLGMPPKVLAQKIAAELGHHEQVASCEVAGPGFINFTLTPQAWHFYLKDLLNQGLSYGDSQLGQGKKINIEYVSANPTGPMHAGHGRNAILGDTIASLFQKVGYDVCREYYINDAGNQIDHLAKSVYLRYQEILGKVLTDDDFGPDMYPADYLIPVAQDLVKIYADKWLQAPESQWLEIFRDFVVQEMLKIIKSDLKQLGVEMDVFTSEKSLIKQGKIEQALATLQSQDDVYVGTLEPPKGHVIEDWEERPQTLFRATKYGDDVDRPLKKSDGSWTYFASDIAYHADKFTRGFDYMVDVLGADHAGYIKRMKAAVGAITQNKGILEIPVCQLVSFKENGIPLKMSKRAGTFIKISDVVERAGKDVTRFMMITRRHDIAFDFDFAKVMEKTRENPVFYVHYAYARTQSVFRNIVNEKGDKFMQNFPNVSLDCLTNDAELEMIKILINWPKQVEMAAIHREPHRIATYLYDVASCFHSLWNKGRENTSLRFIDLQNDQATLARLALLKAVEYVIGSGFALLGIEPMKEMS